METKETWEENQRPEPVISFLAARLLATRNEAPLSPYMSGYFISHIELKTPCR